MNRENFEALLKDLYAIYNTSKVADIPSLMDKYNGQEFDAIKTIFIRYNFRGHPNYDATLGTDKHVKFLIEKYSQNDRVLQNGRLAQPSAEEVLVQKITEAGEKVKVETEKAKQEAEQLVSKKTTELDEYFKLKKSEIDSKFKVMEDAINKKMAELDSVSKKAEIIIPQEDPKQKIELKLELDFNDEDLVLPKEVKEMGQGARLLLYNSKKEPKGLEIKDVLYDCISEEGKCIKTMTIQRI